MDPGLRTHEKDTHSAGQIVIVLDQFHWEILQL